MTDKYKEDQEKGEKHPEVPKSKQLVHMLSFRMVPAYFKEIERVANDQNTTVSALIRRYIKEGMKRDLELDKNKSDDFRVE